MTDVGRVSDEDEDYYAEVERHFVALRGSPLFVSPAEWQLIHRWREAQIPLRIVKQGLDHAFAHTKSRRPIRRLSYCRQTVEASYRRFREAVAGGGKTGRGAAFSPEDAGREIRDYLEQAAARLAFVRDKQGSGGPLPEAVDAIRERLHALRDEAKEPVRLEDLEQELEELETTLVTAAEAALDRDGRDACRESAEQSFRDYRARMPEEVYQSALRSAYLKRVRARFGLPSLSLFHL